MEYNRKEKKWESQYWHPTVTTDSVVFGFEGESLHILLIKRNLEPFKDKWALPGGFIREDDITAKDGAYRELQEETSIDTKGIYLEEFKLKNEIKGIIRLGEFNWNKKFIFYHNQNFKKHKILN